MKLRKKIILKSQMTAESGLHIGDSKESMEIGGVDLPVVRRKDDNVPYIPGSSIKGKLRSLWEISLGENANSKFESYVSSEGQFLERIFGSKNFPSRIIVRDADMNSDSKEKLSNSDFTDLPYTEIKFENTINRILGKAENPRQIERVPAGTKFDVEVIVNIVDEDNFTMSDKEESIVNLLKNNFKLLENDYLGGSGSRGYGRVKFSDWTIKYIEVSELLKVEN